MPSFNPAGKYYDYSEIIYPYDKINPGIFNNKSLTWYRRFGSLLPFYGKEKFIDIAIGETPIISSKKYKNCYFKDEGKNPSGCFKDRESALIFPILISQGYKKFSICSSGNAAVSAALFANFYNCQVTCYVPRRTSKAKTKLIKLFNGKIKIAGNNYEEVYRHLADRKKTDFFNITTGILSIRDQGNKIISYEIFDHFHYAPDFIVLPSANGSLLYGMHQGFKDLKALGLIKHLPKLISIQMKNAAPLAKALKNKKDFVILKKNPDSKAEGLIALESYCSPKAVKALKESKGQVFTITEKELEAGMKYAIQTEGILPEWTSASVFGALPKLYAKKIIKQSAKVVVINTGSGMKEISDIADFFIRSSR